ncbi:ferric-chelate reductase-like protein [Byssothecium circinans]|uniref:Ferric-chelate reductase-like protein n=1 Tax=Byssothecium circinans TaxID=147558 RepID=A0A6A5UB63_9PLEO|nr:ferric-chelate reductase-like protein [Byssothecium circinans]
MKPLLFFLLLVTCYFFTANALRSGKWCFEGCELSLNYAEFTDVNTTLGSHKTRACQSRLRSASLYLCVDEFCEDTGREEWMEGVNQTCRRLANVELPPYEIIDEYPKDGGREGIKRLSADEAFSFPKVGEVVIPEGRLFVRAFETLEAAYYQVDIHVVYGWCMIYFWATVIAIGISMRLLSLIPNIRKREWQSISTNPDSPSSPSFPKNRSTTSSAHAPLKRYITIPATFNGRCSQPLGWCTIPSRVQSLTIFSFVLLNVILCSVDYRVTHGNLYWPQEYIQLWRYVSDRTGIISLANFPMIWLFGMRNHVLMWITGWGYGTYNNFHRWVARVSTFQAVVHSVGYTVMIWEDGGWTLFKKYLHKHYFWNGEIATLFMCLLLIFSVYGLRRSHYEIFLTLHIGLSVIALLTMYYHVEIFTSGEWNVFIYPCVAVWLFDRLLRSLRILAFNRKFWDTRATVVHDPYSNIVRMDVPFKHSVMEPKPGTYYYIYVLDDILYAHQNHPFTLAYVASGSEPPSQNTSVDGDARPLLHPRPQLRRISSTDSTESDSLLSTTSTPSSNKPSPSLVFLIRPYNGFTSRLAKRASQSESPTSLRVLIEGPYGHATPLHTYPNILFIVGGTGIAVPLSHIAALLAQDSCVTTVRVVWAVREHAFLASVLRELEGLLEDERVSFEAHVTQDVEGKGEDLDMESDGVFKKVKIEGGRPDVMVAVEEAAREAGQERLAVMACGPGRMADQARRASVEMLAKGYRGVEYFEESFKW